MPAVIKIGYSYFAIKSQSDALAALKALADAVEVDRDYISGKGVIYYPTTDKRAKEIGVEIVPQRQFLKSKPVEEPEDKSEVKLLHYNGPVHYHAGPEEAS